MAMNNTATNDAAYTQVTTGAASALLQFKGDHLVYLGAAPAASAPGFDVRSGEWLELTNLAAYGDVWAKSATLAGSVTNATA